MLLAFSIHVIVGFAIVANSVVLPLYYRFLCLLNNDVDNFTAYYINAERYLLNLARSYVMVMSYHSNRCMW